MRKYFSPELTVVDISQKVILASEDTGINLSNEPDLPEAWLEDNTF